MKYYKPYRFDFNWKYEAENFIRRLKRALRARNAKAEIRLVPIVAFSSSSAQKWNLWDRLLGYKKAETKITGYAVTLMYKATKYTME